MHSCALKTPLYSNYALPWRFDIMEYSSIHSSSQNQAIPLGLGLLLTCTGVAGILAYGHTQALRLSLLNSISLPEDNSMKSKHEGKQEELVT